MPAERTRSASSRYLSTLPSVPLAVEYGVDLGAAGTMIRLRDRWNALNATHPKLTNGLRPLVSLRENAKGDKVEMRLIVGPLPNAAAAAEFCGALTGVPYSCLPAAFDGQRLAIR